MYINHKVAMNVCFNVKETVWYLLLFSRWVHYVQFQALSEAPI